MKKRQKMNTLRLFAGLAMVLISHSALSQSLRKNDQSHSFSGHVGKALTNQSDLRILDTPPRTRNFYRSTGANPINFSHEEMFQAPVVLSDATTKELNVTLTVAYESHQFTTFRNGQSETRQLYLRGYNGGMVGPTLVARPGDTLKVRLVNQLPPETHHPCNAEGVCDHNRPHNFNTTNLHTHGLHVDPKGNSDNIFIKVLSGEHFDYEIKIPEDHVAGTFWYHAHVHGGSSVQVGSGVAGALIVKGDYDEMESVKNATQKIMLFQEIAFNEEGKIENNDTFAPTAWQDQAEENGWHISINGQVMPQFDVKPGELQHWRFIAGGVRKYLNLKLVNPCTHRVIPMVQIAADGIPFDKKRLGDENSVFLAPGYRNDVLTRMWVPGAYYLIDAESPEDIDLGRQYCDWYRGQEPFKLDSKAQNILARINVSGQQAPFVQLPQNSELASLNRPRSIADNELSNEIELLEFDIDISVVPWKGLINGRAYDPNDPRILKLGDAQTWKISSVFSHHPYHIHVNPFEVIERDSAGNIIDRYWKDTIVVEELDPVDPDKAVVEVRARYSDFTGAFVTHCHILDHEDHGMMEKVIIQ